MSVQVGDVLVAIGDKRIDLFGMDAEYVAAILSVAPRPLLLSFERFPPPPPDDIPFVKK